MKKVRMRYADHVDYLTASVIYLATHRIWWARRPSNLADELSLDRERLIKIFDGFPGIFRRSRHPSDNGEYFYSLQARYAQRDSYGKKEEATDIDPLPVETVKLIYDFILKAADDERSRDRTFAGNSIAVGAALVSSFTVLLSAYLRH